MDQNRWEHAHASFLRGKKHLLRLIQLKTWKQGSIIHSAPSEEGWEVELTKLKHDELLIHKQFPGMWLRVEQIEGQSNRIEQMATMLGIVDPHRRESDQEMMAQREAPLLDLVAGSDQNFQFDAGEEQEGEFDVEQFSNLG